MLQKLIMPSALGLTVGLVLMQYAHGYIDPEQYRDNPVLYQKLIEFNEVQELLVYCNEHASDSANPILDLVDKGLLSPEYQYADCQIIKSTFDDIDSQVLPLLLEYYVEKNATVSAK